MPVGLLTEVVALFTELLVDHLWQGGHESMASHLEHVATLIGQQSLAGDHL
ncbi:hypothetical protein L683_09115 [Pseudomonas aeruginosa WC55]|jgi:hypothetical protein|nr:hypothetical protein L683_09115 [Pseudomonas aeruginosa WC55]